MKFLSTKFSKGSFNFSMLLLRVATGVLLMSHGYAKLVKFEHMQDKFMNFAGLGTTLSLVLIVFAEFFCSIFVILGLFTRFACIPIMIGMIVVVFIASKGNIFHEGERGFLYLISTVVILLCGPGRLSLDSMMGK